MEVSSVSSAVLATFPISAARSAQKYAESTARTACTNRSVLQLSGDRRPKTRPVHVQAVNEVSAAALDPAPVQITWQIIVGAIAGVTPFLVAGVEFSKRIVAQRRCKECGGSGLVVREASYFRCHSCGGFLPWQSWRRFFSG